MVAHASLVDKAAAALLDKVIGGGFAAGKPLPSQDQLATMLGVSRLTVREAVKSLAQSGILRVEHGNGTFINSSDRWTDFTAIARLDPANDRLAVPRALIEVRRMIEVGAAELCAQRADADVVADLDRHIAGMVDFGRRDDVAGFVRHDIAFHDAILRGTRNPFVAAVFDPMRPALEQGRTQTSSYAAIRDNAVAQHRLIRDAIASGDAVRARAAMAGHMDQTEEDLEAHVTE